MQQRENFELFDAFPDPIFWRQGTAVGYLNAAAGALFPTLAVGEELPLVLLQLLSDTVTALTIEGVPYTVTATASQEGLLLVLRRSGALPLNLEKLADQLRQKMSNLLAASGLLAPAVEQSGDPAALRYLATMNQSLYRMLRIVGDLDLAGRMEGEREAAFQPRAMDIAGFCHQLSESVYPLAQAAELEFHYESNSDSLITVADSVLLRRMLLALLSNAFLAAGRGGAVSLKLTCDKSFVRFTVADNGPGVPPEALGAYFDGGPENTAAPTTGLGLGMRIVRYGAQLHGGTVMAESREGKGLQAVLSLPVRKPKGGLLKSAPPQFESQGGFSPLLVELSDALPWQVFLPRDLE
ncbi:MAG: HAMP domain-containing sensor histidine kinase [Oscillospiraceae bacterium]